MDSHDADHELIDVLISFSYDGAATFALDVCWEGTPPQEIETLLRRPIPHCEDQAPQL